MHRVRDRERSATMRPWESSPSARPVPTEAASSTHRAPVPVPVADCNADQPYRQSTWPGAQYPPKLRTASRSASLLLTLRRCLSGLLLARRRLRYVDLLPILQRI